MNISSSEKINLRIILLNVCPFIIITVFFFFGYVQDILILPVIIWLTSVNIRTFEKFNLFIIAQSIMLGALAITNSASALLYHFIISDDYESLWIIQNFTRIEAVFLIIITIIFSVVKKLVKKNRSAKVLNNKDNDLTKKIINSGITLLTPSGKIVAPAKLEYDDGEDKLSKITVIYNGTEYRSYGKEYALEDTFANLQRELPSDVKLACCMTCKHGNMCPFGNAKTDIFCMKDIVVKNKTELCDVFGKENDTYNKHSVASFGYCNNFVYQSDDYYTYNSFLYHLYKNVSREETYYYYILLSNGLTDGYNEWLNYFLEKQNPLSDIVLNLSFCGNDINSAIPYLYSYSKEYKLNDELVCNLLREFLRKCYTENRLTKPDVCRMMYKFAVTHEDPSGYDSDAWNDMLYMDTCYSLAEDGSISMKKFDEIFFAYLYNGTKIPSLH